MMDREEDDRREAAIASAQSLLPNFNSKGVSQDQLSKFRVWIFCRNSFLFTRVCMHVRICVVLSFFFCSLWLNLYW